MLALKEYQRRGVSFLLDNFDARRNSLLCDEPGLGKTVQSIIFLSTLVSSHRARAPFLIICPLSVLDHWHQEFLAWSSFRVSCMVGTKEDREDLRSSILDDIRSQPSHMLNDPDTPFDVLLTTYDIILIESDFLSRFRWRCVIVDEAHRLKNPQSVLYQTLTQSFLMKSIVLLTGTPIQNNLEEMFALLHFINPTEFSSFEEFLLVSQASGDLMEERISNLSSDTETKSLDDFTRIRSRIHPYFFRRTKADVEVDLQLPSKIHYILRSPFTPLQLELYRAILQKNIQLITSESRLSLQNVILRLRQCADHPYLFDGVEPEPFELGDHIVHASGKLLILDILLSHLKIRGHRVLVFSQFTSMLDIIQDMLDLRNHQYERLDGSVRGDERFEAIRRFSSLEEDSDTSNNPFVFLLSTRAGGVGLNLTAADTVIFVDSDWNPQVDIQAENRVHRIGQNRSVRIFVLLTCGSIDEAVYARALQKKQLAFQVLEGGSFSPSDSLRREEMKSMVLHGVEVVLGNSSQPEENCHTQFGLDLSFASKLNLVDSTREHVLEEWVGRMSLALANLLAEEVSPDSIQNARLRIESFVDRFKELNSASEQAAESFLGKDSPISSRQRRESIDTDIMSSRRRFGSIRTSSSVDSVGSDHGSSSVVSKRKKSTSKDGESISVARVTTNLSLPDVDDTIVDQEQRLGSLSNASVNGGSLISYVVGSVFDEKVIESTFPELCDRHRLILLYVDDSGRWGRGGLFSQTDSLSSDVRKVYETAKKRSDLRLGDAHLCVLKEDELSIILCVVHSRNPATNSVLPVDPAALRTCYRRIASFACNADKQAVVHSPRVGGRFSSRSESYGLEKTLKRELCEHGIPVLVYHFKKFSTSLSDTTHLSPSPFLSVSSSSVGENPPLTSLSPSSVTRNPPPSENSLASLLHAQLASSLVRPGDRRGSPTLPSSASIRREIKHEPIYSESDCEDELFDGFAFFLSPDECDLLEADRKRAKKLVLLNGGLLFLSREQVSTEKRRIIVVSNPIGKDDKDTSAEWASVEWIEDCCARKKILDIY